MRYLPEFLIRLDRLRIFYPGRWPHPELIGRCVALAAVAVFLGLKVYQFGQFPQTFSRAHSFYTSLKSVQGQPLFSTAEIAMIWGVKLIVWLAETGILLGYASAYLTRVKPRDIAAGFMETFFPIGVAGIPVIMAMAPARHFLGLSYGSTGYLPLYLFVMGLMALGGWINLTGLLTLRRAFTIMTEARELVCTGIFRYVRHPLYLGHFLMFFASLLLRWHWYNIVLYILFFAGQVIRAKMEERKLGRTFEAYTDYRRRTGMFIPKLGGQAGGVGVRE